MSDEKKADTGQWRIDSLEEDDEIIELTDEIESPAKPKSGEQDQLDEIVIDLEDDDELLEDELEQRLLDADAEEDDFGEAMPEADLEQSAIESDENITLVPEEEMQDLIAPGTEDIDADDDAMDQEELHFKEIEEENLGLEEVIELEEDALPPVSDDTKDILANLGVEDLAPDGGDEEAGVPDIESEVDVDEVTDLEPMIPETIPALEEGVENNSDQALHEELTADIIDPVLSPGEEVIEISDFDQQYFDDQTPAEDEDDDFLELIDVQEQEEDGDEDDEIIYLDQHEDQSDGNEFDDSIVDSDIRETGIEPLDVTESETSADLRSPFFSDPSDESTEQDLIPDYDEAHEAEKVPGFFESTLTGEDEDDEQTETTAEEAEMEDDPAALDGEDTDSAEIPEAISEAQIQAAVANIIERDYAERIEKMVAGAIEKVVSLEIGRIKAKLFEDDQD